MNLPALILALLPLPVLAQPVLNIAIPRQPAQLDPQRASTPQDMAAVRALFEGLLRDGPDSRPVPALAATHEVSENGLTHRLRLNPAQWSDGQPLTAADAVAALRRLADPALASPHRGLIGVLHLENAAAVLAGSLPPDQLGARAEGDTLVLITTQPVPALAAILTHSATFPIPAHALREGWTAADQIVTSGAFRPAPPPEGAGWALRRNPDWRLADSLRIEGLNGYINSNAEAELDAFSGGRLDIVALPPAHLPQAQARFGDAARSTPLPCTMGYVVNLGPDAPPALQDPKIRQALSLALNRDEMIATVLQDGQRPAWGWTPPDMPGFAAPENADAAQSQEERTAEAAAILSAAGYDKDRPLRVHVATNADPDNRRMARALRHYWQDLNVTVRIDESDWETHAAKLGQHDFMLARYGWCGDYADAAAFQSVFGPSGTNPGLYADAEYQSLLAEAAESEGADRAAAQTEAEARLIADLPVIPVFHYAQGMLVAERVQGFSPNPMGRWYPQDLGLN